MILDPSFFLSVDFLKWVFAGSSIAFIGCVLLFVGISAVLHHKDEAHAREIAEERRLYDVELGNQAAEIADLTRAKDLLLQELKEAREASC